jgi:hypothetical protein
MPNSDVPRAREEDAVTSGKWFAELQLDPFDDSMDEGDGEGNDEERKA